MRLPRIGSRWTRVLVLAALVVGAVLTVGTSHADAFYSSVPAVMAWLTARKAAGHAEDAANNTNGKLDIRLAVLGGQVRKLVDQMDRHLRYHADRDDQ